MDQVNHVANVMRFGSIFWDIILLVAVLLATGRQLPGYYEYCGYYGYYHDAELVCGTEHSLKSAFEHTPLPVGFNGHIL